MVRIALVVSAMACLALAATIDAGNYQSGTGLTPVTFTSQTLSSAVGTLSEDIWETNVAAPVEHSAENVILGEACSETADCISAVPFSAYRNVRFVDLDEPAAPLSTVPEPQAVATLATGLALIALGARVRKRQARP